MNLDACWSRESQTVTQNAKRAERQLEFSKLVGLEGPYVQMGNLPDFDHCGYEVAIAMLLYSRKPGKHNKNYTQFDTIRQLRSTYSNYVRASPQANEQIWSLGDFKGNYQRLVPDECGSVFFKRFMEGMKRRMGQDWRPNIGLSTELVKQILLKTEMEIDLAESPEEAHMWIVFSAYVTVSYCVSLRGPEGFLIDLSGLRKYWDDRRDHVVISLLGKVKGESHDISHLLPCVTTTKSEINVKSILKRLIEDKEKFGFYIGPAISDSKGNLLASSIINDYLHKILLEIFEEQKSLFPSNITTKAQIIDRYQCFRSFRRASDTRALEMRVHKDDVDIVNRWRTVEEARGKRPNRPMRHHYAQFDLLLGPFMRYTLQM